jgi:hypothetical protein
MPAVLGRCKDRGGFSTVAYRTPAPEIFSGNLQKLLIPGTAHI